MRLLLRHPYFWLVLGWIFIIVSIVASLVPSQQLPPTGLSDKWEHSLGYSLLTLWFTGIYPKASYFKIGLAMFALGVGIEFAQGAMALGRQADPRDVFANSLGIAAGLLIATIGLGGWAQRIEVWLRKW
jgi:VanZ like family